MLGHGDLVWRAQRLVVEYEGDAHRSDVRQRRIEVERHEEFRASDWTVMRVTEADLDDPEPMLGRITRHLAVRALR